MKYRIRRVLRVLLNFEQLRWLEDHFVHATWAKHLPRTTLHEAICDEYEYAVTGEGEGSLSSYYTGKLTELEDITAEAISLIFRSSAPAWADDEAKRLANRLCDVMGYSRHYDPEGNFLEVFDRE